MTLPHSMLDGAIQHRAEEYAATLYVGATVDANDWRYLDETEWGRLVEEELAARGLHIDRADGVVVPLLRRAVGT